MKSIIKLELHFSHTMYYYDTKTEPIKEVRSNGLKPYEYTITDVRNNTIYKQGIWLSKEEEALYINGAPIRYIKLLRSDKKITFNSC